LDKNLEDLEPLLPSQVFAKVLIKEPETPEQRIAWRLLIRNICDVIAGPKKQRLKYINEIQSWILAEDAPYPFSLWCEHLGLDAGYVKKVFTRFLRKQRNAAKMNLESADYLLRIGNDNRSSPLVKSHLVQKICDGLYGCTRCERLGAFSEFEDNICDG